MARVVRKAFDVFMIGVDNHGGLFWYNVFNGVAPPIPGPPAPLPPGLIPAPPGFHLVVASSKWYSMEDKSNATVLADGDPIVSKTHEAKHNFHVPPGLNVTLPVTILFASSNWMLGVGSVVATNGPVASTVIGPVGTNYNCADPCAIPAQNLMVALSTVHVSPSAGDYASAALQMGIRSAIELAVAFGFGALSDVVAKWLSPTFREAAGRTAADWAVDFSKEFARTQQARALLGKLPPSVVKYGAPVIEGIAVFVEDALKDIGTKIPELFDNE